MHYIQLYILDQLVLHKYLRNSEMRPPRVESNLYQYHLKRLIASGCVFKVEEGYTLSARGLAYADRHSTALRAQRPQPKLVTTLLLTNTLGEVLLVPRAKQPFIGLLNLPSGKIHEGESLIESAQRELCEKVGIDGIDLTHAATAHIRLESGGILISDAYSFVMTGKIEAQFNIAGFYNPDNLPEELMPGIRPLIKAALAGENYIEITTTADLS